MNEYTTGRPERLDSQYMMTYDIAYKIPWDILLHAEKEGKQKLENKGYKALFIPHHLDIVA